MADYFVVGDKIDKVREVKQGMMSVLLSGKIRLVES